MKVDRVPLVEVRKIADSLGLTLRMSRDPKQPELFLLRPAGDRYRIKGKPHACPHGYEALIEAIFDKYPGARIVTVVTTYLGADDFEERQEDVWEDMLDRFGEPDCKCV